MSGYTNSPASLIPVSWISSDLNVYRFSVLLNDDIFDNLLEIIRTLTMDHKKKFAVLESDVLIEVNSPKLLLKKAVDDGQLELYSLHGTRAIANIFDFSTLPSVALLEAATLDSLPGFDYDSDSDIDSGFSSPIDSLPASRASSPIRKPLQQHSQCVYYSEPLQTVSPVEPQHCKLQSFSQSIYYENFVNIPPVSPYVNPYSFALQKFTSTVYF